MSKYTRPFKLSTPLLPITSGTSEACGLEVWKSANSGNCFSQDTVIRQGPLASACRDHHGYSVSVVVWLAHTQLA